MGWTMGPVKVPPLSGRVTGAGGLCLPEDVERQDVPPALAGLGSVRQAEAVDRERKLERQHLRESTRGDYA